jgi:hypothetical protein
MSGEMTKRDECIGYLKSAIDTLCQKKQYKSDLAYAMENVIKAKQAIIELDLLIYGSEEEV